MDTEQFRKAAHAAVDDICDYFETIKTGNMDVQSNWRPGQIKGLVKDEAPQEGEDWETISADVKNIIMPGITHWQHPRFFAFFPANTTYESILGDMWATTFNNPGFNWTCSPVCTELEVVVNDWVAKMLGLSEAFISNHGANPGGGIIMGSASEASLTMTVAARERAIAQLLDDGLYTSRDEIIPKLVLYGTAQTHSLGAKAALILGIPFKAILTQAEDEYSLRGHSLEAEILKDQKNGMIPFMLIATVGSTSSGAIDNLAEIVKVKKKYPTLFVHVDAAWGGVFLSCPEFRDEACLTSINEGVDSFNTNLHKSGLIAFDASFLWVRERTVLTSALDVTPPFLRSAQGDAGTILDYRNMQLALGRRFRSIKAFFVLRSYGISGFQAHLRKLVDLAKSFEKLIQASPDEWELIVPRRWALVTFRYRKAGMDNEHLNEINKLMCDTLAERNDAFFTQTKINSIVCLRLAVGSYNSGEEDIEYAWKVIKETGEKASTNVSTK